MSDIWFALISKYSVQIVDIMYDNSQVPCVLKDRCFVRKKQWIKDEYNRQQKIAANAFITSVLVLKCCKGICVMLVKQIFPFSERYFSLLLKYKIKFYLKGENCLRKMHSLLK